MTLHDGIRAVVEERLALARAAAMSDWRYMEGYAYDAFRDGSVARHIAANDPADAILAAEHALDVLDRHRPAEDEPGLCRFCFGQDGEDYLPYPCPEVRALATRYGVEEVPVGPVLVAGPPEVEAVPTGAIDLMAALRASLEGAKAARDARRS